MSNKNKKYTITSALPYANGALHLGHFAGAYLPGDVYARFLRLMGADVAYVCGSDEHGASITIRAKKEGISPKDIIDKYHELNKSSFMKFGMSFDIYHRTSEKLHYETAQEFFLTLDKKGEEFDIIESEQYYDEEFDQFLADRYIKGTCPKCSYEEAYGDQCENCGSDLSPMELINPLSTLSEKEPILRKTKHWYFKLDKHAEWLKEWIENGIVDGVKTHNPKDWKTHVRNQCLAWVDDLKPRAITRDLNWGIPVPLDNAEGKVFYVWFDAPIGYISATKQWAADNGKDWEEYWKGENSKLIHFVGKDNIVFHCVIFPAMMKAHGGYNLPINVPANQFLNFEGKKFSKSRSWGIELHQYLEDFKDFPNKEDAMRYALIRNMPENKDADFKWDEFVEFHDNELVNNLGNFINRVLVLSNKYYEGNVPAHSGNWTTEVKELSVLVEEMKSDLLDFKFRPAIIKFMEISSFGNTYLQDKSPWSIYKTDPESQEVKDILFVCIQMVSLLAVLIEPFLPFTSDKINTLLSKEKVKAGDFELLQSKLKDGEAFIKAGHKLDKPSLLFSKIGDPKDTSRLELVNMQKAHLAAVLEAERPKQEAIKETISYDDFIKMDIRTGTILEAEKVPKTDKLIKLIVDIGLEKRTVVSGIAEHYKAEEIVGQEVLLLANLAPRKLKGIESQGMILMAENESGVLCFASSSKKFGNGWVVR